MCNSRQQPLLSLTLSSGKEVVLPKKSLLPPISLRIRFQTGVFEGILASFVVLTAFGGR